MKNILSLLSYPAWLIERVEHYGRILPVGAAKNAAPHLRKLASWISQSRELDDMLMLSIAALLALVLLF